MTYLSKLTMTQLKRPQSMTPTEMRRAKLIAKLEQQLALAQATVDGTSYMVSRAVWKHTEDGGKSRVQQDRPVKAWWWRDGTGLSMVIRYGARPIELAKGKRALAVPNVAALVEVIGTVIAAVQAGELDTAIDAVAGFGKTKIKTKLS